MAGWQVPTLKPTASYAKKKKITYVTRFGQANKRLTKQYWKSVGSDRTKYCLYGETEKQKKESHAQGQKSKVGQDYLDSSKKETFVEILSRDGVWCFG